MNGAYWIYLRDRRTGEPYLFEDSFIPGLLVPDRIVETLHDSFCEKAGLCDKCTGAIAHVIEEGTGRKFCPILFSDLLKTPWTAKDLI